MGDDTLTTERHRRRSCATKLAHPTRRAAKRVARLTQRGSARGGRVHAYACRYCLQWHVGHPMRRPLEPAGAESFLR